MTAFDSDDVDRVTTVDVSIEVLRNEHAPQFDRDNIQLQLNETARIGEPVLTLTASDEDPADVIQVATHRLLQRCHHLTVFVQQLRSARRRTEVRQPRLQRITIDFLQKINKAKLM